MLAASTLVAGFIAADSLVSAIGKHEAAAQTGAPPNVVVVMTDDQDARSLKVMSRVRTLMTASGTKFTNSFATFPLCCPSRATFLTGQYAHNHLVLANGPPDGGFARFDDSQTLPVALQDAGYRTGYVGKYLNGYGRESQGNDPRYIPPGWNDWRASVDPSTYGYYDYTLNENGTLRQYGSDPADYQTDVFRRKARRFIDRTARSRPFFLLVSVLAPHRDRFNSPRDPVPAPRDATAFEGEPLPRPPSFNELDVSDKPAFVRSRPLLDAGDRARLRELYQDRLASLLAVDDAVAAIVGELRDERELQDTVIVFSSDNGYMQGEHRLEKKSHLYEESAKVPLIIRGPGFPAGVSRSQVTGNIDLAPTILELAGAQPLPAMDGRSLLPLASDPGVAADRSILLENRNSRAVRTREHFYAEHPEGERELYDLAGDPHQLVSRHDDPSFAGVVEALTKRLRQLELCVGTGCE